MWGAVQGERAKGDILFHKPLDSLVVHREFTLVKFCRDPAIAVSSFVFMVDGRDLRFHSFILICTVHPLQMIVESGTEQLSDCEKNIQRMSLPQLLNYQRFLRWRRSSSKTKACKFFR